MTILALATKLNSPMIKTWARIALVINIVIISALAFLPGEDLPEMNVWDKGNHFFAFFVLTLLLYFCFVKAKMLTQVILPLILYGVFIEVVQGMLQYREISFFDVVADGVGIAFGIILIFAINRLRNFSDQ